MGTTIFVKSNSENLFKDALLITNTTQVFLSMDKGAEVALRILIKSPSLFLPQEHGTNMKHVKL